jgi:hypothetical protein
VRRGGSARLEPFTAAATRPMILIGYQHGLRASEL